MRPVSPWITTIEAAPPVAVFDRWVSQAMVAGSPKPIIFLRAHKAPMVTTEQALKSPWCPLVENHDEWGSPCRGNWKHA